MRKRRKYYIEDWVGKNIHEWTILGFSHKDRWYTQYWNVRCKCGLEKVLNSSLLNQGRSRMCIQCFAKTQVKAGLNPRFMRYLKREAGRRGKEFSIALGDLEKLYDDQQGRCALSGEKLTLPKDSRDTSYNVSVDRIDSSIGYIPSNIQLVTKQINIMKNKLSDEVFINLCADVVEWAEQKLLAKILERRSGS